MNENEIVLQFAKFLHALVMFAEVLGGCIVAIIVVGLLFESGRKGNQ